MKTKIAFLILPRIHLLDLAGPLQVFQEANDYGADFDLLFCSESDTVNSSVDFPLGKLLPFADIQLRAGDYLVVPGADVQSLMKNKSDYPAALADWVCSAHDHGANIVSVCTGAFFLGSLGLLNGRKCTTHWKHTERLKKTFPKIHLVENVLHTEDAGILTSAGVTAGIDLALHIVAKRCGERVAFNVARELVVYLRRAPQESQQSVYVQYRNHVHYNIHKVQDYVQDNLDKGASLPVLSDVACMSTRNLTRTFKKETGITINAYLTLIRMEKLKELSQHTDYTRKQMARYCGLKSERQVMRLLKQL
jgi:transcriptional regulator GlxA family with amidase domain